MFCLKRLLESSFICGRSLLYLNARRGCHESSKLMAEIDVSPSFLNFRGLQAGSHAAEFAKAKFGWPTKIQSAMYSILFLKSSHVLVRAKTGSGKTFASLIAMVKIIFDCEPHISNVIVPSGIIILPSLELCQQAADNLKPILEKTLEGHEAVVLSEGDVVEPKGLFILVSTPDRLLSYLKGRFYQTPPSGCEPSLPSVLIIDEADQLLSNGSKDVIKSILAYLQCCMSIVLSSNISGDVEQLKRFALYNPYILTLLEVGEVKVEISPYNADQYYIICKPNDKLRHFLTIMDTLGDKNVIFCNSVYMSKVLKQCLEKHALVGSKAEVVDAELDEHSRLLIFKDFNDGRIDRLIITTTPQQSLDWISGVLDGINLEDVDTVFNFDMPRTCAEYAVKADRCGRAHTIGELISLVYPEEEKGIIKEIKSLLGDENSRIIVRKEHEPMNRKHFKLRNLIIQLEARGLSWKHLVPKGRKLWDGNWLC